jgi:hypothetical protein
MYLLLFDITLILHELSHLLACKFLKIDYSFIRTNGLIHRFFWYKNKGYKFKFGPFFHMSGYVGLPSPVNPLIWKIMIISVVGIITHLVFICISIILYFSYINFMNLSMILLTVNIFFLFF